MRCALDGPVKVIYVLLSFHLKKIINFQTSDHIIEEYKHHNRIIAYSIIKLRSPNLHHWDFGAVAILRSSQTRDDRTYFGSPTWISLHALSCFRATMSPSGISTSGISLEVELLYQFSLSCFGFSTLCSSTSIFPSRLPCHLSWVSAI